MKTILQRFSCQTFIRKRYKGTAKGIPTGTTLKSQENSMAESKLNDGSALQFNIIAECPVTKARTSLMKLPHFEVELPMFMPVGTQGTMKGLTPEQVKEAGAQIILGNTYHLGTRPGVEVFDKNEGLHNFMQWDRALLTDSGGFQMVSLLKLAQITEEGVKFQSPYDGSESMLTPEESIHIQNSIGADIIMQLDDVVDVKETDYERFKIATERTTRWLDRCIKANKNPQKQNLFPIIQGGLFPDLRRLSLEQLIARNAPGYAIGGLSGGEDKNMFWPTVHLCTDKLPKDKPRYCMGVGFPVDLVVCCALGVDMFDCVHPTRTARFGCALIDGGQLNLKSKKFMKDFRPIDQNCVCSTCQNYTRAYIKMVITRETIGCHLISIHNIAYQMKLMKDIRESIKEGRFVQFVKEFMQRFYKDGNYPQWIVDALEQVNITLDKKGDDGSVSSYNLEKNDTRSPSREKKLLNSNEDFWDETEDEKEFLDRMSGFKNLNFDNGFRNSVLEEYKEKAEEGRQKGYLSAFKCSGIRDAFGTTPIPNGNSHDGNVKKLIFSPPLNNSWLLSQWLGVLLACHAVRGLVLSAEDHTNLIYLKDKVSGILSKEANLEEHLINHLIDTSLSEDLPNCRVNPCITEESLQRNFYSEVIACITECIKFCNKVKWKVPPQLLVNEQGIGH